jgi:dsRNA-specific ribonuclease
MKARNISELEQALGYQFSRPELVEQALTHSSQARELEALHAQTPTQVAERLGTPFWD